MDELADEFKGYIVPKLKQYLQAKGISVTGYKKANLLELAQCASKLNLSDDPNLLQVDTTKTL